MLHELTKGVCIVHRGSSDRKNLLISLCNTVVKNHAYIRIIVC